MQSALVLAVLSIAHGQTNDPIYTALGKATAFQKLLSIYNEETDTVKLDSMYSVITQSAEQITNGGANFMLTAAGDNPSTEIDSSSETMTESNTATVDASAAAATPANSLHEPSASASGDGNDATSTVEYENDPSASEAADSSEPSDTDVDEAPVDTVPATPSVTATDNGVASQAITANTQVSTATEVQSVVESPEATDDPEASADADATDIDSGFTTANPTATASSSSEMGTAGTIAENTAESMPAEATSAGVGGDGIAGVGGPASADDSASASPGEDGVASPGNDGVATTPTADSDVSATEDTESLATYGSESLGGLDPTSTGNLTLATTTGNSTWGSVNETMPGVIPYDTGDSAVGGGAVTGVYANSGIIVSASFMASLFAAVMFI